MLKSLECSQLIKQKIDFNKSLNVLLGPDDGTNSIGKSSVLMLIDFAFGGDDFLKICSDVIDNIGEIEIKAEFLFDNKSFHFVRKTSNPNIVKFCFLEENEADKQIEDFRKFLSKAYNLPENYPSFRSTVNPYFRIWGKDNYNPNKPLNSFPNEPYLKIRTNLLKLFGFYSLVDVLEKNKSKLENKKKIIQGMFNEGFVQKVSKKELVLKRKELAYVQENLNTIKNEIELYALSVNEIINKDNLKLKIEKNELENKITSSKFQLLRIEKNLKFGSYANAKTFERLSEFFPDVNQERLLEIEKFHIGISKILKNELLAEKEKIEEKINVYQSDIKEIDDSLKKVLSTSDKPVALIDELLELSIQEKKLSDIVSYAELKGVVDSKSIILKDEIEQKIIDSLDEIQKILNQSMAMYIDIFYQDHPAHPTIKLSETSYEFNHNQDTGTGKSHANMIALDFSIFEHTHLPVLIHDLILFKNIEVHACEQILKTYLSFDKQTFIAIDELKKYSAEIIDLVRRVTFLELSPQRLAFKKSWKKLEGS